ncbi:MAG: glycosyltransferase family 4 protein [Proteobacteria bacterium]|nr:glycosyltransferase family 4 protein [Pseudomonadota bacterium]
MRILLHDYGGYHFSFELGKALSQRSYEVMYLYTDSCGRPKERFKPSKTESLCIMNVNGDYVQKDKFFIRYKQELDYGTEAVKILSEWSPDLVISANTPLLAQIKIIKWAKSKNIPFVFWMQDILSVAVRAILRERLGSIGFPVYLYFNWLERNALLDSSNIVVISEDFASILEKWGIKKENVTVISNWAPIEEINVIEKVNDFSLKHDIANKFVVLYSGTMGMKHDPDKILAISEGLSYDKDIVLLIISEGVCVEYLRKSALDKGLGNLVILPFQPYDVYSQTLASADVLLDILKPSASIYSVPSRVWSGFCAGRPSILVMPKTNLVARIAENIGAGFVVSDNSVEQIIDRIRWMKSNPYDCVRMGQNARTYAEKYFCLDKIVDRFEVVFEKAFKRQNLI